jgi:hypothetical protein
MKIIFAGKEIIFGDWVEIFNQSYYVWLRRISLDKNYYVEWAPHIIKGYLIRNFQGLDDFSRLRLHYDQMYPNKMIPFNQKKEAKSHMDEFLVKFNSLKAFL